MVDSFVRDFSFWSIDSAGEEVHYRIKFESKIIKIFVVANAIVTMIGTALFTIPLSLDDDVFYALYFFKTYIPEHKYMLTFIYKLTYPFLGYVMIVHPYQFLYAIAHARFQIIMFIHYVANIAESEEDIEENEIFYDKNYQQVIQERLKFCVKRHLDFLA